MRLPEFSYHRPESLEAAIEARLGLGEESTYYAGGTELLIVMKMGFLPCEHVIDLKGIAGLSGVREDADGRIAIGALTTLHALATSPLVRDRIPSLAAMSRDIANIRVRVAGTIGGNLCFAEPRADPPALLAALDASLELAGAKGTREVAVGRFFHGQLETERADDEILTRILMRPRYAAAYRRFAPGERPSAGAAVALEFDSADGAISAVRVWVGAATDRPAAVPIVEEALAGVARDAVDDALAEVAEAGAASLDIEGDEHGGQDYKRHLAATLIRRAVRAAAS